MFRADDISVVRERQGPEVLLVHGGASPATTWAGLAPLTTRWTLAFVHRRGYPPSPPGRHDFEVDAVDLAPLLDWLPREVHMIQPASLHVMHGNGTNDTCVMQLTAALGEEDWQK